MNPTSIICAVSDPSAEDLKRYVEENFPGKVEQQGDDWVLVWDVS